MTTEKQIRDLTEYAKVLPNVRELFGVYQPLLGWESNLIDKRFKEGFLEKLKNGFAILVDIKYNENSQIDIQIRPSALEGGKSHLFDSVVLEKVYSLLPRYKNYERTGAPRGEILVGEPWDVRVPNTLVIAREKSDFGGVRWERVDSGARNWQPMVES